MSNQKKRKKEDRQRALLTPALLKRREKDVLDSWMKNQLADCALRPDLVSKEDLKAQSKEFLEAFIEAISTGNMEDIEAPEYKPIVKMLEDISRTRTAQGFTSSETVTYIFSLQYAIFQYLQAEYADKPEIINQEMVNISKLIIKLGLVAVEVFSKTREEQISKQIEIMAEMSIPVITLWESILMIPTIGSVDSKRAQLMMELILKKIAETQSKIVIIDILGVPSVDTAVANHILKIARAAKLMGCECVISGISPAVAQTMVSLGIEMVGIITTANLKDALVFAYKTLGVKMVTVKEATKKR